MIKEAVKVSNLDDKMNFDLSPNREIDPKSDLEWLISEYRNKLTHFNDVQFDEVQLRKEFRKVMRLSRRLVLFYIEPSLHDFPFPSQIFDRTDCGKNNQIINQDPNFIE